MVAFRRFGSGLDSVRALRCRRAKRPSWQACLILTVRGHDNVQVPDQRIVRR